MKKENQKNKIVAILLAYFLGTFGAHKFYLGKTKQGILFILFSITGIPTILSLIDCIRYLIMSNKEWNQRIKENKI